MDYTSATDFLYRLRNRGSRYGIDRMPPFVCALGNPEAAFPVIHVAGTNGKGSVCAMLEAVFRASGRKTGMFTSPHLVRLGERVQVNRRLLSEEAIARYVGELLPAAEKASEGDPERYPTFFEFMTAMGFLHFARERVDVALIEVGLGGRLDATNVVCPAVSVITSIGLDHCEQLGETLGEIAGEKAGIIKPGVPVVLGPMPAEAEKRILSVARERGSPVHSVREIFGEDVSRYPACGLEGECQRLNAATARVVLRVLEDRFPVGPEIVECAFRTVEWAGRWQRLSLGKKQLIIDASHNEEALYWLDQNLSRLREATGRKPVMLAGALGERRARALMAVVARHAREIHLLRPDQPRAVSCEVLESLLSGAFEGPVYPSTADRLFPAPGVCTAGAEEDTVVLTGSIYLIGEVLQRLHGSRAEPLLQG